MWLLARMVFWLGLIIALLPIAIATGDVSVKGRGSKLLICC